MAIVKRLTITPVLLVPQPGVGHENVAT